MAVGLRQLDYFSDILEQGDVQHETIHEYLPIASYSDPFAPITFAIPFSELEYWNISDTLLRMRVKFKITKPDGAAPDWEKLCPTNMLLHSMFRNIDLKINGKLVTNTSMYYPYLADIQAKLRITKESKSGFMTASGYYEDNDDKDTIVTERKNKLKPALETSTESKTMGFAGKLFLDIASQPKYLPGGVTVELTLHPVQNPMFYFMSTDTTVTSLNVTPTFEDIKLFVTKSTVFPETHRSIRSKLDSEKALRIDFTRNEIKSFTIAANSLQATLPNVCLGELPRRVFLTLVDHETHNGSNLKNPFNYKDYKLNFLQFLANGVAVPARPFQPDYDKDRFEREYLSVYEALNELTSDPCYQLPIDKFASGNTIYAVNLGNDTSDGINMSGYRNPKKQGDLRIDMRFAVGLPKNVTCLLFLQYDSTIIMTNSLDVLTDFN